MIFCYYVVFVGRKPGIYTNWVDFRRQLDGYSYSRGKGYNSLEAAEAEFRCFDPLTHNVYTSGCLDMQTGQARAGWGVYWRDGRSKCGPVIAANTKTAQLTAIDKAITDIMCVETPGRYRIYTDSEWVLNALDAAPLDEETMENRRLIEKICYDIETLSECGNPTELAKVEEERGHITRSGNQHAIFLAQKGCLQNI